MNFSIKQLLIIGISVFIASFMLFGFIAFTTLNSLTDAQNYQNMRNQQINIVKDTMQLQTELNLHAMDIIIDAEDGVSDERSKEVEIIFSAFSDNQLQLVELADTPEEEEAAKSLKSSIENLHELIYDQLSPLITTRAKGEFRRIAELDNLIDDHEDSVSKKLNLLEEDAKQNNSSTVLSLIRGFKQSQTDITLNAMDMMEEIKIEKMMFHSS